MHFSPVAFAFMRNTSEATVIDIYSQNAGYARLELCMEGCSCHLTVDAMFVGVSFYHEANDLE